MKTYRINNSGPLVNSRLSFVAVGSGILILRGLLFTKNEQRHEKRNLPFADGPGWPVSSQIRLQFNSLDNQIVW